MWNLLIRMLSAVVKVTGAHLCGFCIIAFSERRKYYLKSATEIAESGLVVFKVRDS